MTMGFGKEVYTLYTPPPSTSEFGDLVDGDEVALIIDVNGVNLKLSPSDLRSAISISLISDSLGPAPSIDKLKLSFLHAFSYFSFDSHTHNSILHCSAIAGQEDSVIHGTPAQIPNSFHDSVSPNLPPSSHSYSTILNNDSVPIPVFAATKKHYKPAHRKVQPVPTTLPENFRILCHFPSDPLENMPTLNPNPPPFTPTGRYTQERMEVIDKLHDRGFFYGLKRGKWSTTL